MDIALNYRLVTGSGTSGNLQQGVVTVLSLNAPYGPDHRDWPMYYRNTRNSSVGFLPATLSLTKNGNNLLLSWPLQQGPGVVQYNTNLASTVWYPLTTAASLTNGQNRVALSPSNTHRLFRLNYP